MKKLYFLLGLFAPLFCAAQANFQPGFITTLKSDTIKGYIDYREWNRNPKNISFKSNLQAKSQTFSPTDIESFGITNLEYYESHLVKISMDKTSTRDLAYGLDTGSITSNVFLKLIQTGSKVTLFSYNDDVKKRFYIRDKTQPTPVELVYKIYLDPDKQGTATVVRNTYYSQLQVILNNYHIDSPDMIQQISNLRYQETDLVNIAAKINGGTTTRVAKSKGKSGLRYFVGAGLNASSLKYAGESHLASNNTHNTSFAPKVALGADIFINPNVGQVFFRTEAGITENSFTNSGAGTNLQFPYTASQAVKQYTGSLSISAFYTFYNTTPLKIFVGTGITANFSSYPTNQYIEQTYIGTQVSNERTETNFPDLQGFWASIPIKIGVIASEKLEFWGTYIPSASATSYSGFSGSITSYQIGFNYLFGR